MIPRRSQKWILGILCAAALATNGLASTAAARPEIANAVTTGEPSPETHLETARRLRAEHDPINATKHLVSVLASDTTESVKQTALLELALTALEEKDFARAQQILSQFVQRYPSDSSVPEILLRQGQIYRQMGANRMALAKFYAVMTAALSLKTDSFQHYREVVAQAQTEIAETFYRQGDFSEAADFLGRLLKQEPSRRDQALIRLKLIRCLSQLQRHADVITEAQEFLARQSDSSDQAEVRFHLVTALKAQRRVPEARTQLLQLLQPSPADGARPLRGWLYWQQRAGNEIANQLYNEADFANAIDVYAALLHLSDSLSWRVPVLYQIGLINERLQQPQKAAATYAEIAAAGKQVSSSQNIGGLKLVIEMAQWRAQRLAWLDKTEQATHALTAEPPVSPSSDARISNPTTPRQP
jgi:TolA-binding protein